MIKIIIFLVLMDSDGLLQCPYDKNHLIRPSRFPYHLVKCRENNQAVAKVLATCPFNARHRVPKKELDLHMQSCESKCPLEPLPDDVVIQKAECVSSWQSPQCEENWEDDSSASTPFVLNEFGNCQPYSSHDTVQRQLPPRATSWEPKSDWKPEVSNGHFSRFYTSGSRAANHQEPVYQNDEEWPRLGSNTKANRHWK
ncbi:protein D7-like isoform X1 [Bufo bufo]|uniref:protein D7-like isoform X1 n=2 Tax=Bufo bufo TaxID=8384 RepID=UPI001ABDC561|nr:protein D7-like isoform X1 [Bufo bufo]